VTRRKLAMGSLTLGLGAVALWLFASAAGGSAFAQDRPQKGERQKRREGVPPGAGGGPRDVTLKGQVLDIHCFATGQYPSPDQKKCTADCIAAGVPAILRGGRGTGIVVLGQGASGAGKLLQPLAFEQVEVQGKLYEKGSLKYLDIASIKKAEGKAEEPGEEDEP